MQDISSIKEVGSDSALSVISKRASHEYGVNSDGASIHWGANSDEIAIHIEDGQSTTAADDIITAIALPTCTHSSLAITVDCGTYLVADVTNIAADPDDIKYAKVAILIDDTTGVLEVVGFTKTVGEYGSPAAGKTLVCWLKEYSVPAAGSALTEIDDLIS